MKQLFLTLAVALFGYGAYAQSFNPTSSISSSGTANSLTGGYTFAYATSGSPWNGAFMSFGGFGNNYDCQLNTDYGPNGGNHISFRTRNGDAGTWNSWYEVWHSGNLNNSSTDFTAKNIYANGNVGIGTASPNHLLTLNNPSSGGTYLGLYQSYVDGNDWRNWTIGINNQTFGDLAIIQSNATGGNPLTTGTDRFYISKTGNVGIGTTTPDQLLSVAGTIHSKQVKVDLIGWPDYVFKPKYNLLSLSRVKAYIDKNQHLPEMPSEAEVSKNGINLGEIVKVQTKKIEELTLYVIQQDARIAALEAALTKLTVNNSK